MAALVVSASAQGHKNVKQSKRVTKTNKTVRDDNGVVNLTSSSQNAAFGNRTAATRLYISDPTVLTLDARANNLETGKIHRPIIGVPTLRYGTAHGHLLFYNTSATSSGSFTGTGNVGTGTSIGNVGMGGMALGVNGKNPYAESGIW